MFVGTENSTGNHFSNLRNSHSLRGLDMVA